MAPVEKRKNLRRTITYPAWIELGNGVPARECSLCDVSDKGAQITVAEPDSLPDEFILALSADGAATRRCRVIWKNGNQVGVQFLKPTNNARRSNSLRFDYPLPPGVEAVESNRSEHADPSSDPATTTPR